MDLVSKILLLIWCFITSIHCNIKYNYNKFNNFTNFNNYKYNNYRKYNNLSFITVPINLKSYTTNVNSLNDEKTVVLTEKPINAQNTDFILPSQSKAKILPFTGNLVKNADKLKYIKNKYELIKVKINDLLYPKDSTPEVVKFINYKYLERFLLSFYSSITTNIKFNNTPESVAKTLEETANKQNGNKFLMTFTSFMFKDLFSKIINYYWFNKLNVSSSPKLFRISSTLMFSLFGILDSFINYKLIEPKVVLLAINNVFKQLSLLTLNNLNNVYTQDKGFVVKDNNYIFDLLGMSFGLLASHILNKFGNFKFTAVLTNLIANNLTSFYLTSFK
ncbi:uncharacterized protein TA11005 [Theileria annulata]|uniref:Uncharacterized protein n=1 Tax=Theileria annulata TaxID=5874 RepID=Q4U993_THEAN|nr:uncharacterized protein TA11005 [Theileria annulata]CAI76610.1 hypothetical protein TA11005 [Theileria annulata]|eukprot:XP_953235.1 hypothetical protein TA11005 [Theileria annulata]